MKSYVRLPSKFLIQTAIKADFSWSNKIVNRALPVWDRKINNNLGPLLGDEIRGTDTSRRSAAKENGVIVYLSRSRESDLVQLRQSLTLLRKNFLGKFPYPVIVFHEDIGAEEQSRLSALCPGLVRFELVDFKTPEFLTGPDAPILPWRIGYCHMCNFFSGAIFEHSALASYTWYWRLDIDSYLLTEIGYDPFARLNEGEYNYGYLTTFYEDDRVCEGLADWVKGYVAAQGVPPTFLNRCLTDHGNWNKLSLYTNFEIGRLSFWRSPEFKRFWKALQESHGIYEKRWGDAPLHLVALSLYEQEAKLARFADIGYRHVNYFACP